MALGNSGGKTILPTPDITGYLRNLLLWMVKDKTFPVAEMDGCYWMNIDMCSWEWPTITSPTQMACLLKSVLNSYGPNSVRVVWHMSDSFSATISYKCSRIFPKNAPECCSPKKGLQSVNLKTPKESIPSRLNGTVGSSIYLGQKGYVYAR